MKKGVVFGKWFFKLKNRRNLLLQLKYNVVRLRLGNYEEGFRIPYERNPLHERSKKQYQKLEYYRLRSFYGVFDLRSFKEHYFRIQKE